MKKRILSTLCFISLIVLLLCLSVNSNNNNTDKKQLVIEEVLETESYKNLSPNVKEFIKDYYAESGEILLTKDLAGSGESYLNPIESLIVQL